MKFCPYCGMELMSDRAVFCMECGSKLPESPKKQMVKSEDRNTEGEPTEKRERKKRDRKPEQTGIRNGERDDIM